MTPDNPPAREENPVPNGKTVQPDGNLIRKLRERRDWSRETLIRETEKLKKRVSKKSLENIENGKEVKSGTLQSVAEVLRVKLEDLTVQGLELTLERSFDLSAPEQFLSALRERLDPGSAVPGRSADVQLIDKRPGNLLLLKLSTRDGERVLRDCQDDRLRDLQVVTARRIGVEWLLEEKKWSVAPAGPAVTTQEPQLPPEEGQPDTSESGPANQDQPKCSVLVVDDDSQILPMFKRLLSAEFEVLTASDADAAEAVFSRRPIDIILTDQRMPKRTGVELLEWVKEHSPRTVRLLMTACGELDDVVEAINRGHVYYFLHKPCRTEDQLQVLRNAAEKCRLERSRDQLVRQLRQANRELEAANQRLQQRTMELEQMALTDPLTGLFNRRAIEELARFELRRRIRFPAPLGIGLNNVDPCDREATAPPSNNEELLGGLARILANLLRQTDSVGRLQGEKFLVLARETGPAGDASLAERLRRAVANTPLKCNGQVIPITLSIGFAAAEDRVHADLEDMTAVADQALTHARTSGGNRCEVHKLTAACRPAKLAWRVQTQQPL